MGLGLVIFTVRLPLLDSENVWFLIDRTALPCLIWISVFLLFMGVFHRGWSVSERRASASAASEPRASARADAPAVRMLRFAPAGVLAPDASAGDGSGNGMTLHVAVGAALVAFLAQESINFGLFVPGAGVTVAALAALFIAGKPQASAAGKPGVSTVGDARTPARADRPPARKLRSARGNLAAVAASAALIVAIAVAWPAIRASSALKEARAQAHRPLESHDPAHAPAVFAYERAAAADPLDATACEELAQWLASVAQTAIPPTARAAWLDAAVAAARSAIARDPYSVELHRLLVGVQQLKARHSGSPEDFTRTLASAIRATELYPTDPDAWILRGRCALDAATALATRARLPDGSTSSSPEELERFTAAAVESLERALSLDAQRPAWEELRRFSPTQREQVGDLLQQARALRPTP
ncbi:MAG: hypothetical protein C4547_04605 [Phycisphaerales bacterium]|nr:MAG: hypothetical protein C4547_04605 [Phycisphaerales bacterium]